MHETSRAIRLALPAGGQSLPPWAPDLDPVEIAALLSEADRLGVWPAVYRNLRGDRDPRVRAVTAKNLSLRQEQSSLLVLLAEAGVQARSVKGVGLAERLYPDLSWREVSDIDVLVSRKEAARAFKVLRSAGLVPNHDWTASALARLLARSLLLAPELVFLTPAGLILELHWDWPGDSLRHDDLLEAPESYLVYLCRHAGKHFWSSLKWCCDIELFVRRFGESMDWTSFWRVAAQSAAERSCAVSLELCRRWFGGPPVPGLEIRLNRKTQRLAERAAAELLNPSASRSNPVWNQFRLAPWRHRPVLLRTWLSPQPQEWNRAEKHGRSGWRVWIERGKHLWARWAPHRVRTLSSSDWRILIEASLALAVMEAARRVLPAHRLLPAAKSSERPGMVHAAGWTLEKLRRVAWLTDVAANRQPLAMRCLTRSLALAWMLRRRGIDVELRIGVKNELDGLRAHAWVEWQGQVLHDPMNHAADYAALAGAAVQR